MKLLEDLNEDIQKDIKKAKNYFKSISAIHALILIAAICGGCWFGIKVLRTLNFHTNTIVSQESNIELLLKNVQVMNEPAVLLKIIRECAPSLPAESQARSADAIFRTCSARGIPVHLACGLSAIESQMNPYTNDSSVGAVGWFQVMPSSARPYMNFNFGGYSKERLKDPVTNAICGLNIFADLRDAALERGLSEEQAIINALGHYNCGNEIQNNGFAKDVLSKAKYYKSRFETSMKELR